MARIVRQSQNVPHEQGISVEGTVNEIGLSGDLHFPAAVVGEAPGFVFRISDGSERFEDQVFVVNRDDASSVSHDLGDAPEKLLVRVPVQADRHREVGDAELFDDIENEVGDGVRHVPSLRVDA